MLSLWFDILMVPLFCFMKKVNLSKSFQRITIAGDCHMVMSSHSKQTMSYRRKSCSDAQPSTSGKVSAFQPSSRRTYKKSAQQHYSSIFLKLKNYLTALKDNPAAIPCSDTIMICIYSKWKLGWILNLHSDEIMIFRWISLFSSCLPYSYIRT